MQEIFCGYSFWMVLPSTPPMVTANLLQSNFPMRSLCSESLLLIFLHNYSRIILSHVFSIWRTINQHRVFSRPFFILLSHQRRTRMTLLKKHPLSAPSGGTTSNKLSCLDGIVPSDPLHHAGIFNLEARRSNGVLMANHNSFITPHRMLHACRRRQSPRYGRHALLWMATLPALRVRALCASAHSTRQPAVPHRFQCNRAAFAQHAS